MKVPQGTVEVDHPQVVSITFASEVGNPEEEAVEIFVTLKDGRHFSFTAYTPRSLEVMMQRNGWPSFVDLDMMIVREIGVESVLHALDQMLALGIERFGLETNVKEG